MRSFQLSCLLLLPLAAACHDSSDAASALTPVNTSLGIALVELASNGDLCLVAVSETAQGGSDLNGDGDTLDRVAHVLDLATGELTSTSLDVTPRFHEPLGPVPGELAVLLVSEAGQGGQDLNGDGDAGDLVVHVYDRRSKSVASLGISGTPVLLQDEFLCLLVSEEDENRDLDGDSVVRPGVMTVHLYDQARGELVNLGLETSLLPRLEAGFLALARSEFGGQDLNGDGDQDDPTVLHVYESATRTLTNVELAVSDMYPGAGLFVLNVHEGMNGGVDLNFDGDALDGVLRTLDPRTGILTDTGFSAPSGFTQARTTSTPAGSFVLATGETDGLDRNGDGDVGDTLPVIYEPHSGRSFDPGLALGVSAPLALFGQLVALRVNEAQQGLDLNGDGDEIDELLHVVDPVRRTVRRYDASPMPGMRAAGDLLVLTLLEEVEGEDLDGDSDREDAVPFLLDGRSGRLTNTRISSSGASFEGTEQRLLFLGREQLGPFDFRFEFQLHDVRTGKTHPLGLESSLTYFAGLGPSGRAAVASNEARRGEDLNGDGDLDDDVLFLVE
jgi:hypothetical protein